MENNTQNSRLLAGLIFWSVVLILCWLFGVVAYVISMGLLLTVIGGFVFGWEVVLGVWAAIFFGGYKFGQWGTQAVHMAITRLFAQRAK